MPTTSNFGWTTPADTDLVKDGAAAIRTLGNNIDASLVDLKGGTTGQVLSKASNTDLDFTWSSVDPLTILDAKGDLISASAADTPTRLASSGVNGDVLTVDTSTSTGLKWAAVSSAPPKLHRLNANYYISSHGTPTTTQLFLDENSYLPVYLPSCTISRLAIRTASTFSGTASMRIGLYNNAANNIPGTVLIDGGTVSATAASTTYEITVNQTVTAGWYWTAVRTATAATTNTFQGYSGSASDMWQASSNTFITRHGGFTENGLTGAFATAVGANLVFTSSGIGYVGLRIN